MMANVCVPACGWEICEGASYRHGCMKQKDYNEMTI